MDKEVLDRLLRERCDRAMAEAKSAVEGAGWAMDRGQRMESAGCFSGADPRLLPVDASSQDRHAWGRCRGGFFPRRRDRCCGTRAAIAGGC